MRDTRFEQESHAVVKKPLRLSAYPQALLVASEHYAEHSVFILMRENRDTTELKCIDLECFESFSGQVHFIEPIRLRMAKPAAIK